MKSKYKVESFFGMHIIWKGNKSVCECRTKHQAYKIKKALEQYKPVNKKEEEIPFCWDCINENIKIEKHPCNKCKAINKGEKLYFQPKEKK